MTSSYNHRTDRFEFADGTIDVERTASWQESRAKIAAWQAAKDAAKTKAARRAERSAGWRMTRGRKQYGAY